MVDNELYKSWTDYLKEKTSLSLTKIASKAGISKSAFLTYRDGRANVFLKHFEVLAEAFPDELIDKAKKIGITVKRMREDPDMVKKLLSKIKEEERKNAKLQEIISNASLSNGTLIKLLAEKETELKELYKKYNNINK